MILDDYASFYFVDKPSYTVDFYVDSQYLLVGVCSNFEDRPPNKVTINDKEMDSEAGITTPNLKGRVEIFSMRPKPGECNLKVVGQSKFSSIVSIFGFSEVNQNPIKDFQTQTGSTFQQPDLNLLCDKDDMIVSLFSDDTGATTHKILDCFEKSSYKLPLGLAGSFITGGDKRSSMSFDRSESWCYIGFVVRGIFKEPEPPKPKMMSLTSPMHLMSN
jgi:hypothetical protein